MGSIQQGEEQMKSKPHVFVGVKDTDPTSNLRPSVSYRPGKSTDFILIKPVETDFFNENLKELINSPYDFLEELGLHTNFGILIRDKGNEKRMVDAIVKKKSFVTSGYYGDKIYAVDANENRLKKTLENYKVNESTKQGEKMINEKKKETVADFLKRGGKITKVKAGTGKEGQKAMKAFKKKYGNMKSKEAELDAKDKEERERNEAVEMNKYMNALSFNRNTNIWAEAAKDGMDPEPVSGKKTFTKKTQEKVVINPIEKEGNSKQ